jgi:hypothetical protein
VRDLYPLIQAFVAIEDLPHALLGGIIAANAQLPPRVNLAYHTIQPSLQPVPLWVEDR